MKRFALKQTKCIYHYKNNNHKTIALLHGLVPQKTQKTLAQNFVIIYAYSAQKCHSIRKERTYNYAKS